MIVYGPINRKEQLQGIVTGYQPYNVIASDSLGYQPRMSFGSSAKSDSLQSYQLE